ncbi:MAG: sigma-70 family RNA polymerase sigma factor [Phycisphaerales bacterium]|nr:sigma-70 family RNA polymerase sigma factor [Phycisphaerales bacterium]
MLLTSTTLLQGLGEASDNAWQKFDFFYRPFLTRYARRYGLTDADADDVSQVTMLEFRQGFRCKYDRRQGRMRHWVIGILKRQIASRKRQNARHSSISIDLDTLPSPATSSDIEEQEWRRAIVSAAIQLLKDKKKCRLSACKIDAFLEFGLRNRPAQNVAEDLGISVDDVFRSKYLCLRYLKKCQHALERFYQC